MSNLSLQLFVSFVIKIVNHKSEGLGSLPNMNGLSVLKKRVKKIPRKLV